MSAAVLDHLWQSTLFAACAWLTTLLLRRNGAHLRYGVWLIASIKFLIPFSLLAMLGAQLKPFVDAGSVQVLPTPGPTDLVTWLASPSTALPAESGVTWLSVAGGVWILGFVALAARWFVHWRRVRKILRVAEPSSVGAIVPVMASAVLREPAAIGIFRPILLLPAGIEGHLSTGQLEAILEHELCHVRRHDNLTAAIHMLVEALFWFHPLVWWIGARLIEERERACDEAVVRAGSDPRVYAEGILEVCRSYGASALACVSGISGANLKTRLEGIMKTGNVKKLGGGKILALAMLASAALAAPILIGLASPAQAETPAAEHATNKVGKIVLLPGKRVRLNYKNVDVRELLRAMGEAAQVNVLANNKISNKVTVDLAEMPWEEALNIILNSAGLVSREKDGILFVDLAPITGQAFVPMGGRWQPVAIPWKPNVIRLSDLRTVKPDDKC